MRSSEPIDRLALAALAVCAAFAPRAAAQIPAQGFALERFVPSAPGAGWFVMDDLDIQGELRGAVELTTSVAHDPLVVGGGGQRLAVVSSEAFADLAVAASWKRFRLYLDLPMPLLLAGESGTIDGHRFSAPLVNLGTNPDSIADPSVGVDALLAGRPGSAFRLGAGAQLFVPSNGPGDTRASYLTDGTVRAMARLLAAGDLGSYRYAGELGGELRPLDDWPTPGSPQGSELLFGAAAGRSFPVLTDWALIVGPELWGETAFASLFGSGATGLEGLLTGRLEGTGDGEQLRFKLGAGGGIVPQFGAPEWRVVLALELFGGAAGAR